MERINIKRFIHEKLLGMAMFFGSPGWADNQAKTLGYNPQQRRDVLMETHLAAESRSRIIWRDYDRARYHEERYFELLRDPEAIALTVYTQPKLFN